MRNISAALMALFVFGVTIIPAHSEELPSKPLVEVLDTSRGWGSDKFTINAKDTPRVFLWTQDVKGNKLENIKNILNSKFSGKGFVVVDTAEESDIALSFGVFGDVVLEANDQVALERKYTVEEIGVTAFAAVATGGLSLVISQLAPKKEGTSVTVMMIKSPTIKDDKSIHFDRRLKAKDGSSMVWSVRSMSYKRAEKTPVASLAVVNALFDDWIKHHIVEVAQN